MTKRFDAGKEADLVEINEASDPGSPLSQGAEARATTVLPSPNDDPESEVGMPPGGQNLASPLAGRPSHVADAEGVGGEAQPQDGRSAPATDTEDTKDMRPKVKRLWLALTDPDRPGDSASVDWRIGVIRYLEKLMRTEFANTTDLRQHVERYLAGYDGRRLPVPQAIKRARKKLKLTQRQLAEKLGFKDHTLISKYEKGQRVPSEKTIEWLKQGEM